MRDCTEVFDEHGNKFIPFLEEDIDDYKSELWSAFYWPQISVLPKKGDLVVYIPQGHLEYKHSNIYNCPPPKEPSTHDLEPHIICRVDHVQLFIKKEDDDICSYITLHPEPEVSLMKNKLEQPDKIEDWIWDEHSSTATKSTRLFAKILRFGRSGSWLYIPLVVARELFHLDMVEMNGEHEVTAKDFHGKEWKFPYNLDSATGSCALQLKTLKKEKDLDSVFRIVFLRDKDTKLRFGIRTYHHAPVGNRLIDNTICPVISAILNKGAFSVFYMPSFSVQEFLIPYEKYERSIKWSQHLHFGAQISMSTGDFVHKKEQKLCKCVLLPDIIRMQKNNLDFKCSGRHREIGVVTGISDLDPVNWRNSTWRSVKVTSKNFLYGSRNSRISPWEVVLYGPYAYMRYSPSKLKIPSTSQQDNSSPMSLEKDNFLLSDEAIGLEKQTAEPQTSSQLLPTHPFDIEKQTSESQTSSQLLPTHPLEGYTTNHPFDIEKQTPELQTSIEKQTPEPQTSSQLTPFPDSCSLTSSSESKSTTNDKELKICNCSMEEFWHHVKGNCSFEYLELDSCSFPLSARFPLPTTLKKLKITNCVDAEHVFSVLMRPNQSIESLEIDSCSSFGSMPTGGIPATLRQLKIVNCRDLKSLSESFNTKKIGTPELRKLEIENCQELEFLPEGLHELHNLDILSIKNCDSIRYFPSGGLPRTSLTSLLISGCHHLKCLPKQLHEVTSLQNLTICGCPYLMDLPDGGLPRSLVSLSISQCQNFIPICEWGLHHLEHLDMYSFSSGCLDS